MGLQQRTGTPGADPGGRDHDMRGAPPPAAAWRRLLALLWRTPLRVAIGLAWRFVAARLLSVGGLIVAAAIYGPPGFALFGAYLAVLNVTAAGLFLRYEGAVMAARGEREAAVALRLCLLAGLAVCAASLPILAGLVAARVVPPLFAVMFVAALAARGLLKLALTQATRAGAYRVSGRANLVQAVVQPGTLILMLQAPLHAATVMVFADLVGHATAAAVAAWSQRRGLRAALARVDRADLRAVARHWASLPLLNLPATLFASAFAALPLVCVPLLVDMQVAGQLALAYRVLDLPTQLVGTATVPILLNRLGARAGAERRRFARRALIGIAGVVAVIYGGIVGVALFAEPWLAATRWHGLAEGILLLVAFQAGLAMTGPFAEAASVFRGQRLMAAVHGGALVAGLAVFALAGGTLGLALGLLAAVSLMRALLVAWRVADLALRERPTVALGD